ncbi:MAG: response regulator transcription factor [Actinomycetota bacterium]
MADGDHPITVFLLDDHEIVRRGVAELVNGQPDMEVVGEAGTAPEAIAAITAARPQVALLDVRLQDGSGLDVCRQIRDACPEVACVILTAFADDAAMLAAADAGAAGFLLKQIRGTEITDGIRRVAGGAKLLDDATVRLGRRRLEGTDEGRIAALTGQERQVFDLMAEGLTNRQIADELYLAEKTIKNYVTNVLAKLGLSRRAEVAALAATLAERQRGRFGGQ